MKVRTIRTFDEIEAYCAIMRDHYLSYANPRIYPVNYGVFDVGKDAQGYEEGNQLVAVAAIDSEGPDVFEPGGVARVTFEYLIVKSEFRNRGIGTALLNFIIESHRDMAIKLWVSKRDEWERLVSWYERFGFCATDRDANHIPMERDPDDGDIFARELRFRAGQYLHTDDSRGLDLDEFRP